MDDFILHIKIERKHKRLDTPAPIIFKMKTKYDRKAKYKDDYLEELDYEKESE